MSPSLVQFVKDAANGHEFKGALLEASILLERGLALISDPETESGLGEIFWDDLNEILQLRKTTHSEAKSNAVIAEKIILPFIDGYVIMNATHYDVEDRIDSRLFHPKKKGWKGLALGKRFITCILLINGSLKDYR